MSFRQLIQTTVFGLAAVLAQPALCEHPDLTGTWQLDVAASSFGMMPRPDAAVLTISTSSHKMLHMEMITRGPHDQRTVDTDWKVDDRFHPVVGDESGAALAKWEGSSLVGKRDTGTGFEEMRIMPGPGGATLTQVIQSTHGLTTLVWRRQ